MQINRLTSGGRIDRSKPISFTFNGQKLQGYQGDTLASALLANGVDIVGRSIKYHRPRGIVGGGAEEPNAILQIGQGAKTLPNQRATQVELYEGLTACNINGWPSVKFDLMAILGFFSRLLAAGFYYKTFMWPASKWDFYEHIIRRSAGWGTTPNENDPHRYEHNNVHCDILITGAGPAGLAAALAAGRAGARVILCDDQIEVGGSLLSSRAMINGRPAADWVAATVAELEGMPEVTLLTRATAFGHYDDNFVAILCREADHEGDQLAAGKTRQCVWRVRAKRVIHAQGAFERPLVFGNNDRPGIMTASAVSLYLNRFAVKPGRVAVVFTNNDSAYQTALDLHDAGVEIAAVIDSRLPGGGEIVDSILARNIPIRNGRVVVDTCGRHRINKVKVMNYSKDSVHGAESEISCDLLIMSGGWSPAVHLHSHAGGKNRWDESRACFVPDNTTQKALSIGAGNGAFELAKCITEGFGRGGETAAQLGFQAAENDLPEIETPREQPIEPLWQVAVTQPAGRGPKQFVDFQNDTCSSDITLAVREGYHSVEHVKRYTALGFGTDQGKLGNINGMAILAKSLGQDVAATGTTTFRPAYTPVTFGAGAGREIGPELFEPVRKTAMHAWHEENGAEFENVGQWKRPWYYPQKGETIHDAVNRECLATRNSVGMIDATTLGKIIIEGKDSAEFLNRIYTNAWLKLEINKIRYGFMLGEDGMVIDDGVTIRLDENKFYMHTTTGGAAHILAWMENWLQTEWPELEVFLTSVTDHWATAAVVGPNSRKVVSAVTQGIDFDAEQFPFMSSREGVVCGVAARVNRISFSGELAYEVNVPANHGRQMWEALMEAGREYDITPYGTETMHVLRAEKGYVIVGQDTDGSVTPLDLGMDWIVSKTKDFIGRRSLARDDCVREGRKQLVGLLTDNPDDVLPEGGQIVENPYVARPVPMLGHVTSSYYSACLGHSIALALVKGGVSRMGETVHVPLVDGRIISAKICNTVFYDSQGEKQNV